MRKNKNLDVDYAIDDFMTYCQEKDLRIKTIASYESTLRLFSRYIEDTFKINDISKITNEMCKDYVMYTKGRGKYTFVSNDIDKNINHPENRSDYGKKVSTTTINNYIRNLKVFFNYLTDEKIIKKNPMDRIKQFKNRRIAKDQLTDEDFNKLIRHMDTTKFSEFRDYTIVQLIMDTGMRLGECLALRVDDVDLDRRAIFLSGDVTKGRKDRYVFYSYTMSKLLRRWLQYKDRYVETDLLFCTKRGTQLAISNFETNFTKYVKRSKIDKKITAHGLRNNFARRFLLSGGDIFMLSKVLGHSSVTVTEKAYADVTVEDIRKSYQKFSPLENMKKGGKKPW